jgi:RND family efflux transporter MFP subunit
MVYRARRGAGVVLAIGVFCLSRSAAAHEGHGGAEIGPYDLDTPRQVTLETAAHIGLKTAEVDFGAVESVLLLSGIVRAAPDRHWTISTRTAGKVLAVRVQVGDKVTKGELLAEIDSPELARNVYEVRKLEADYQKLLLDLTRSEGRVRQLEVETENANLTARLAEEELKRSELAGEQVIPLNTLAERRGAAARSRGEAKLKEVDLSVAREEATVLKNQAQALRLSRDALLALSNVEVVPVTTGAQPSTSPSAEEASRSRPANEQPINLVRLVAPADGLVIERSARPGHWATTGETLLSIADYAVVQIEGELPESLLPRLSTVHGSAVRVRTPAEPDTVVTGTIKFISPVIDEVKRTAHVLIEVPNPQGRFRDGMFVDLAIVLQEKKDAVVVPVSAVLEDGPVHFVFMKNGDVYQKQDITPGLRNDLLIEVLGGVAPGDVVVTQGAYSLTQLRPKGKTAVASAAGKTEARPHGH